MIYPNLYRVYTPITITGEFEFALCQPNHASLITTRQRTLPRWHTEYGTYEVCLYMVYEPRWQ